MKKISIIIPSFNSKRFIGKTLESIREQEMTDLEVILIDSCSTDSTLVLAEEYQDVVAKIISEPDDGQTDAIAKGFEMASGEIIGWLNSDDTLAPGALNAIIDAFDENKDLGFVYGRGNKIDENDGVLKKGTFRPYDPKLLKSLFYIIQPACYFRKAAYEAVGGLDRKLDYAMDWDLLLKLSAKFEGTAIDVLIANLRIYGETKTSTGGYLRSKEIALVGLKHGGVLNRNWISFCVLNLFEQLFLLSKLRLFLKLRNYASGFFDRFWGHTNYMIHAHTFSEHQLNQKR